MKKILVVSILSLLTIGLFQPYNNVTLVEENNVVGFVESASDDLNEQALKLNLRNTLVGNDETLDVSPIFVQYGMHAGEENPTTLLRFAVAVKGEISSISFLRGEVEGKEGTALKEVNTLYKGISANGSVYYYDAATQSVSTDETLAGQYWWACYTISYVDSTFEYNNIPLSVSVNEVDSGERKVSLAEVKYGMHEHDYSVRSHNDKKHYNVCSLCSTIDDTSYELHDYKVEVARKYNVGETLSLDDVNVSVECGCEIEPAVSIKGNNETLKLGESVNLDVNGTEKKVGLSVTQVFDADFVTEVFDEDENTGWKTFTFSNSAVTHQAASGGFLKFERGYSPNGAYIHTDNFVAPEGSFEMELELRAGAKSKPNQSEITIRKDSTYEISLVFESFGNTDTSRVHYVSSNYSNADSDATRVQIEYNVFNVYKVSVTKAEDDTYSYDIYKDGEKILSNIPARMPTEEGDDIKMGVNNNTVVGSKNDTKSYGVYFGVKYLTLTTL